MLSSPRRDPEAKPSPDERLSPPRGEVRDNDTDIRPGGEEFYAIMRRAIQRQCPAWMRPDIDDLVQQSALKLLQRAAKRPDSEKLSPTFLYRVAYSVIIDEVRRRRVRHRQPDQQVTLDEASTLDERSSTQALVQQAWIRKNIEQCLQTLNDDRRNHLTLKLLGHSVPEISDMLGSDRARARNLVYRGLEQLRECLQRRWKGLR